MAKLLGHFFKVLFASTAAGLFGWVALVGLSFFKIMQQVEGFNGADADQAFSKFWAASASLILSLKSGVVVFFATVVACVPLSEIFASRSLLYYLGATGALATFIAAAATPAFVDAEGAQIATASPTVFGLSGVAAGLVYWFIAGRDA